LARFCVVCKKLPIRPSKELEPRQQRRWYVPNEGKNMLAKVWRNVVGICMQVAEQFVVENMIIVAICGDEKYVCVRKYRLWILQERFSRARSILREMIPNPPWEFDVRPSRGCEQFPRTCFVFWRADISQIPDFPNKFLQFSDYQEHYPVRKVKALEKAFAGIDRVLTTT